MALVLFVAFAAPAFASDACPGDDSLPSSDTAQAARALACDINALRAQRGLPPLNWDWRLAQAADWMANDMAARQYISHTTPDGTRLADRVAPTGYIRDGYTWVLQENLSWARGADARPGAVAGGWMGSTGHRLNIMAADIQDIGIGVTAGSAGPGYGDGFFYVADFGRRGKPRATHRARRASHRSGR